MNVLVVALQRPRLLQVFIQIIIIMTTIIIQMKPSSPKATFQFDGSFHRLLLLLPLTIAIVANVVVVVVSTNVVVIVGH
jgi:hypothetical protein